MPPERRYELIDEKWDLVVSLMPKTKPGERWNDHRTTLDGMMWMLKIGSPWRAILAKRHHVASPVPNQATKAARVPRRIEAIARRRSACWSCFRSPGTAPV